MFRNDNNESQLYKRMYDEDSGPDLVIEKATAIDVNPVTESLSLPADALVISVDHPTSSSSSQSKLSWCRVIEDTAGVAVGAAGTAIFTVLSVDLAEKITSHTAETVMLSTALGLGSTIATGSKSVESTMNMFESLPSFLNDCIHSQEARAKLFSYIPFVGASALSSISMTEITYQRFLSLTSNAPIALGFAVASVATRLSLGTGGLTNWYQNFRWWLNVIHDDDMRKYEELNSMLDRFSGHCHQLSNAELTKFLLHLNTLDANEQLKYLLEQAKEQGISIRSLKFLSKETAYGALGVFLGAFSQMIFYDAANRAINKTIGVEGIFSSILSIISLSPSAALLGSALHYSLKTLLNLKSYHEISAQSLFYCLLGALSSNPLIEIGRQSNLGPLAIPSTLTAIAGVTGMNAKSTKDLSTRCYAAFFNGRRKSEKLDHEKELQAIITASKQYLKHLSLSDNKRIHELHQHCQNYDLQSIVCEMPSVNIEMVMQRPQLR